MHAPFLDHVVTDTAAAIRARWSGEDMSQLLWADENAFFCELARAAIKGAEAAHMQPIIIKAKMKDGTAVEIKYWDKGDFIPAIDKRGNHYEAFSGYFHCDKFRTSVQVDVFEIENQGPEFRRACELNALHDRGVDINSVEWPDARH